MYMRHKVFIEQTLESIRKPILIPTKTSDLWHQTYSYKNERKEGRWRVPQDNCHHQSSEFAGQVPSLTC